MSSAELGADLLVAALQRNDLSRRQFRPFERNVRRWVAAYERLINTYYSPAFARLCLFPERKVGIPEALVSVLAGNHRPGWPVRWRLELFHCIAGLVNRFGRGSPVCLDGVFEGDPEAEDRTEHKRALVS